MDEKVIKKAMEDLKWYLETNEEKGVVYIPEFEITRIVNDLSEQLN